jgi:hypothetical protein
MVKFTAPKHRGKPPLIFTVVYSGIFSLGLDMQPAAKVASRIQFMKGRSHRAVKFFSLVTFT